MSTAAAADFKCADGRMLQVEYDDRRAKVVVEGRSYAMPRQVSQLGTRFSSPTATLIIDGKFAAFVADGLYSLRGCRSEN